MNTKKSMTSVFNINKEFDLNLLTIFEAVYHNYSVTKAAEELDLAPSSVSQEVNKLRTFFDDSLFIRKGKQLVPTTVATNIHNIIEESYTTLVTQLKGLSNSGTYRNIVINAAPYIAMRVLPNVSACASTIVPDCKIIHTSHHNMMDSVSDALTYREADIIFDFKSNSNPSLISHEIFVEEVVLICSRTHPRYGEADNISIEQMKEEKYATTSSDYDNMLTNKKLIDDILENRTIIMTSPSFMSLAGVVESSDYLSIMPVSFYEKFKTAFNLKMLKTDIPLPVYPVYMIYHKSSLRHPQFSRIIDSLRKCYNC